MEQKQSFASQVSHLGAPHTDNTVDIAGGIIEVGDCQCMLASRNPVPLGGRIDLEDMGPGAENRLFPAIGRGKVDDAENRFWSLYRYRAAMCISLEMPKLLLSGARQIESQFG